MAKPITQEQESYLENLSCERISKDQNNLYYVDDFENDLNPELVKTIKNEANAQDDRGEVATYVIKDLGHKDQIMCYFSLKAGILFNKIEEIEVLEGKHKLLKLVKSKKALNPSSDLDLIGKDLDSQIADLKKYLNKKYKIYQEDEVHKRVATTYPAIELTHFCVNEKARSIWKSDLMGSRNRMGLTIFWKKVVPIIIATARHIGVKYLYLFAADDTEDEKLINHYISFMSFRKVTDLYTTLPVYDFGCTLLLQDIEELNKNRDTFFSEFNIEEEV